MATVGKLSDVVFLLRVGFVVGLVVAALIALLLSFMQGVSYYEAAYSTVLTLLLIGPTIQPSSGAVGVLIALTGIDGFVMLLSALGLVFAAVDARVRASV
ncbi:MAG: hypothetical protein JRN57_00820 [Nitrososphaerota archaeon]|nr:hypothetical protein [Nitrososphaerota archaeon]